MFKRFQLATFFGVLTVARAGIFQTGAPVAVAQPVLARQTFADEYDPHPQYNFGYEIQDALSGDSKNQIESRNGDLVQGQYSLTDADGFRRIVDYSADSVNGFNAIVRREPIAVKAVVKSAPLALAAPAPILRAAPPLASYVTGPALIKSAPLVASAGIVKTSYVSPHASYAY